MSTSKNNIIKIFNNRRIKTILKINIELIEGQYFPSIKLNGHHNAEQVKLALCAVIECAKKLGEKIQECEIDDVQIS